MTDTEVVATIYEAMAAVDLDRLISLVDPAVVITQDERLPWGGRFEGHEGFGAFAVALRGAIDSKVEIGAIFAADDEVIQFGRTRGTTVVGGAPFDIPEVHRWKIRDGKAVEAHFAIDTEAMLAVLARN
jgi:ketosteroid isomerase-like protein